VPPLASSQTSPPCSTIPEPKINSDAGDVSTQTIIVPFACPCPPPGTDGKCDTTVKALGRFTLTRTGQQVTMKPELTNFVGSNFASLVR
jgi:hypothetical protein